MANHAPRVRWFLLRGLVREAGHWGDFPEALLRAFPGADLRCLETPGNGASCREPSPLSVAAMARAVSDQARAITLADPADFTGLLAMSLGGMVALQWLHDDPAGIDAAVLVNTSVRGLSPLHHRFAPRSYPLVFRSLLGGDVATREARILELTSNRPDRRALAHPEWVRIQRQRPVTPANALRQILAASRFTVPPRAPGVPTLVLGSRGDRLVDPRCSTRLAEHWALSFAQHPDGGHDLALDAPEWVAEQMRAWAEGTFPRTRTPAASA